MKTSYLGIYFIFIMYRDKRDGRDQYLAFETDGI